MDTASEAGSGVQSIERAMRILDAFDVERPELTLGQLTDGLGMSRASVHRYAVSLRKTGLLSYDGRNGVYRVGPRAIGLANVAMAGLSLVDVARPYLAQLSEVFGETVILTVFERDAPMVVDVVKPTKRLVTVTVAAGARLPFLKSAHGLCFLAFSSGTARTQLTGGEWHRHREELERVMTSRIAVSEDVVSGIRGVAAPIGREAPILGCVGVVGTTTAIPLGETSALAHAVGSAAESISNRFYGSDARVEPEDSVV